MKPSVIQYLRELRSDNVFLNDDMVLAAIAQGQGVQVADLSEAIKEAATLHETWM